MKFLKNNKFIQLWLIIGIIAGFGAILFFAVTYLNQQLLCDIDCKTQNEVLFLFIKFTKFLKRVTCFFAMYVCVRVFIKYII